MCKLQKDEGESDGLGENGGDYRSRDENCVAQETQDNIKNRRRSSAVSVLIEEVLVASSSFRRNLRDFIVESGFFSITAALVPCLSLLLSVNYGEKYRAGQFFGSEALHDPPILDNVTVVPYALSTSKQYYSQSLGSMPFILIVMRIVFWITIWLTYLFRSVCMFHPSKAGVYICIAQTLVSVVLSGMWMVEESKHMAIHGEASSSNPIEGRLTLYIFLVSPFIATTAYAFSEKRDNSRHTGLLKSYVIFFVFHVFDTLTGLIYAQSILPYFFRSDTSPLMRFMVRMLSQIITMNLGIELSWHLSIYAVKNMGCDIHNATLMTFANYATNIPFFSRIMQGSATTVAESILYEVAGTIAELWIADSFLKGQRPIPDTWMMFETVVLRRSKNKVAPVGDAVTGGKVNNMVSRGSLTGVEYNLRRFCEDLMVVLTLTEATTLIISSVFWLVMNANPGDPGSESIPIKQSAWNLGIMIIGELVITDGIIAYASNKSKNRYCVSLAVAWKEMREKRNSLLKVFLILIVLHTWPAVQHVPSNMCYTSPANDESAFALTSCPKPVNITEMTRVSDQYQEEWERYN